MSLLSNAGPTVDDGRYRQRVRRHRPSELVPAVSAVAAQYGLRDAWRTSPGQRFAPWVLADIVRVSLSWANEHRPSGVAAEDIFDCCDLYLRFMEPSLMDSTPDTARQFLLRTMAEQLPWQQVGLKDMARTLALFTQTSTDKSLAILGADWDHQLFGCSVIQYAATGQLVYIATRYNNGRFDPAWLDQDHFREVVDGVGDGEVMKRALTHFVMKASEFRSVATDRMRIDRLRRYRLNPLLYKPVLKGLGDLLVIPVPQAVVRKFHTSGIYYMGVQRFGNDFATDLGKLFEAYVGEQLKLIPAATVLPEIPYGRNQNDLSIDWFVILPSVVFLVEAKAVRPTEPVRLATDEAEKAIRRSLRLPLDQIQRTEDQICGEAGEFAGIPTDRPHIGLVVTLEPFDLANDRLIRDLYWPEMTIPAAVISSDELEALVCVDDGDCGELLLQHLTGPGNETSVGMSLVGRRLRSNPLIAAAWHSYPWTNRTGLTE